MKHFGKRQDASQKPIVDELKKRGIAIVPMPDPGDVLCYFNGLFVPIEFKTKRPTRGSDAGGSHGLTKKQIKTREAGVPIPVVSSLQEALALFGLT